jgi:hypothetical protein
MEFGFPLILYFATLYLDKKSKSLFLVDKGMYPLQVLKISHILLKFSNYYNFLKWLLRKFKSITKHIKKHQVFYTTCINHIEGQ